MNIKKSIFCFFLSFVLVLNVFNFHAYAFAPLPIVAGAGADIGIGAELATGSFAFPPLGVVVGATALFVATAYGVYKLSDPNVRAAVWKKAQILGQEAYYSGAIVFDSAGRAIIKSKSFLDTFNSSISRGLHIDGTVQLDTTVPDTPFDSKYTILSSNVGGNITVTDGFDTHVIGSTGPYCCYFSSSYNLGGSYIPGFCITTATFYQSRWYFNNSYTYRSIPWISSVDGSVVTQDFQPDVNAPTTKLGDDTGSAVGVQMPSAGVPSSADELQNISSVTSSDVTVDPTYRDTGDNTSDTSFWSTLWDWLSKILSAITAIPVGISAIAGLLADFPSYMGSVKDFVTSLPGVVGQIATAVVDLPQVIPKLGDFITDLPNSLVQDWTNLKTWITDIPGNIAGSFSGLKDWITDIPGAILDGLKELFIPDSIAEPFEQIIDDMKQNIHLKYDPILPSKMLDLKSGQESFQDITINYNLNFGALNLGSGTAVIVSAKQINSHIQDVRLLTSVVMSFFFFFYVYSEIYFAIRGVKPFETSNKDVTSQYSDCGGDGKK